LQRSSKAARRRRQNYFLKQSNQKKNGPKQPKEEGCGTDAAWSSTAHCSAAATHTAQRGVALQRCSSSRCAAWSRATALQQLTLRSVELRYSVAAVQAPQRVAALQRCSVERSCCSSGAWSGAAAPLRKVERRLSKLQSLELAAASSEAWSLLSRCSKLRILSSWRH